MTKTVNSKGQIWHEREGNVVKVGFTRSFLDGLDQCWHILPANLGRFREKAPLMVVETNDALISIMSPVSAHFVQWERKAQDFPDQLTEDDVILEMRVGETPARAPEPPRAEEAVGGWNQGQQDRLMAQIRANQVRLQGNAAAPQFRPLEDWAEAPAAPQAAVPNRNRNGRF